MFMGLLPVLPPFYENINVISGQKCNILLAENTRISHTSTCALRREIKFLCYFPDFPVPAVINAQKTIGAYTESISIGPELM